MFRKKSSSHEQELDPEVQELKVQELKDGLGKLSERSSQFCTDACLRRYLEARNWNVDKSKKMLRETLTWRSSFKPEEILWDDVANEGETGKIYRADFHDTCGRSVIVMRPAKQNTSSHTGQLRHLVYLLENAILNLPEGQEQMVWLIDFNGWTLANSAPMKTARETAHILQNHYPERLAVAFLFNPPKIFETFWRVIRYFLDPKTFQKVKFAYPGNEESLELMKQYFDMETLPTDFGGQVPFEYDHIQYSKLMAADDIKAATLWGITDKLSKVNGSVNGVVPEPKLGAAPSS